ncbi:MAG: tyrosine--tRNA ligase [Candidatus Kerfeldbacteria bacterium]|nr:tyrosine--tRNA ligase [Candidatus Kerfeldbacteria bacterium]
MKNFQKSNLMNELLTRGVDTIVSESELRTMLAGTKRLRVYLGVDPTSPVIHIGHAVVLRKLRLFQDLGHEVILLIGDFTAQIGDPTGRDIARPPLTHKEVLANAKSYKKQASTILDFSSRRNPPRMLFNSKWLAKLTFKEIIELASEFTVQQMLERDMFEKRFQDGKPIYLHEFLYPLMVGYDSVAMDVDVELGGSDQLFNILAGRALQKACNKKTKVVMTTKLLRGIDGRKMSKSFGNDVSVAAAPNDMYGKLMSMSDELIPEYFELATHLPMDEIQLIMRERANPRDQKMALARAVVARFHGEGEARAAEAEFVRVFQLKTVPSDIEKYVVKNGETLLDIVVNSGLVSSRGEGRRKIAEGAVKMNNGKHTDPFEKVQVSGDTILKLGRHFRRLK